jgi:glycosyltransferase involved in cell wall biosynthesis
MKILVVTNLYPPHHVGGYELGCRDVVEKLRERGHAVRVLTSSFRNGEAQNLPRDTEVERVLQFNFMPSDPPQNKRVECAKLTAALKRLAPDVVYFWNQAGLCLWLPVAARWHGCRMAFFLSDTSFVSWRVGAWLAGAAKNNSCLRAVLGKTFLVRGWPVIKKRTCHFASEFLRDVAVKNRIAFAPLTSVVAHWGIEPGQFPASPREHWPVKRLLYAGQMIPQKGVHTAIAAFGLLAKECGFEELTFSLAGGGMCPDYEEKLRALPAQLGIADRVHFLGKVPRAELSGIYAEHDVLIFPSEWDEPFAITPLEAMASGLAVVGTTTGGSGELFRNRETAMTFHAGDAADCARALRELCADRELFEKITRNAQREVQEKHTLDAMVDKIEKNLREISKSTSAGADQGQVLQRGV